MNYWGALALIGSLAGCTADKGETDTEGTANPDTSTTGTTAGTDATDPTATTTVVPTTGAPTTGAPTTGEDPTTGGVDVECMARLQDCPEGLKCTAYAKKADDTWDANKCVPVTGDGVYGDPCTVEGGLASGIDDCAKGYICQSPDEEGKNGVCLEFCQPDDSCPNTIGETFCIPANDGFLPICSRVCDPLVQDCPGTQGCYGDPSGPPFFCYGPDPKDGGQDGTKCEFTNACLAGLYCAASATVEGCPADSLGCCTPFCPLDGDVCTGGEQCVVFYTYPPPGTENIGVCVIPA
ncbi:MAG: hypothetical protein H0T76_01205 [Nannocystis sp.]|nr:hypothetical protein [Nannocystis sp.]MBA3545079.1 hypothetical protein [Nannocystis sp.]